ncbi:MAG: hypothetical protein KBT12_00195 [Bacteroidales bacterium]|nr:hypothetical protein [Candidatus Physcousia equi]
MKKVLFILTLVAASLAMTSCGGNKYSNDKFGYSIELPSGFKAQNDDKQMEEERGGKLFVNDKGGMIDVECEDKSEAMVTPEEMVSVAIEWAASGSEVIAQEVNGAEGWIKWKDDFGYRALYYKCTPEKKMYNISVTYSEDCKADFDNDVDKLFKSLAV